MANPQQRPRDFEEILERLEKIMAKERIGDGGDEESLSFPVIFQSQKNKEKKEHSEEERKRKDWLSHCAIAKLGRMVYEYDGMVMLDMAGNAWKELDYAKHVEYAREYQIAYAKSLRLPVERDFTIKGTTFRLVLIPPGRFLMGSPESELERYKDESPQHRVIISKPFWLGKYEVTQAQWKAVMGENPSYFESAGKKAPVEKVSWHDCQDLCQKLSNASGEKICLPTEAQWEYACRAGTLTPFNLGDNITPEQVNYNGNYPYPGGKRGKYRETTVAVGSLPNANAWGLYDMHGNVWEWCADSCTWDRNKWIVRTDTYIDGIGDPLCENGPRRIVRGGSCFYIAGLCRCAFRDSKPPSTHDDYGGMRLCIKVNSNSPC
ncbi:hypothetical protein DRN43_05965 [Thermococci archaeon]|nr:MAG: hypothetical protein DRN43_05965 [Thermococci archaeon]